MPFQQLNLTRFALNIEKHYFWAFNEELILESGAETSNRSEKCHIFAEQLKQEMQRQELFHYSAWKKKNASEGELDVRMHGEFGHHSKSQVRLSLIS